MTDDGPATGDDPADEEDDAPVPDPEGRASDESDPADRPETDAERETVEDVESAVGTVEAAESTQSDPEAGRERDRSDDDGPEATDDHRENLPGSGSVRASRPDAETSAESADAGGPSRRDQAVGHAGETNAVAAEGPRDESDTDEAASETGIEPDSTDDDDDVPEDVRSYERFQKVDRASYDRVNEFLRDRTYVTAREWAIARLCADFRTATGVEMTKIGENLPELVPFMTDTYSPQAVNQARSAFEKKVRMAGATFLYGAMSGFFTADELDELMYEVTEVSKFLLEVEGVELTVDEELDAEDRISAVMREVRQASEELRYDEVACPHCGEAFRPASED